MFWVINKIILFFSLQLFFCYFSISKSKTNKHHEGFYHPVHPLLETILGKITSSTAKNLSYAGLLQLIKSELFSIFVLPNKIVKVI